MFDSNPCPIPRSLSLLITLKPPFPPVFIQFPVPTPSPRKESYAIRPLSYLLNFITKHFGDHSAPRPCTSHQPLHTQHSPDPSQLFPDKGSLLRLVTFPEASVPLKHTMASPHAVNHVFATFIMALPYYNWELSLGLSNLCSLSHPLRTWPTALILSPMGQRLGILFS